MKKIFALLLAMMLLLSLAACGGTTDPAPSDGTTDPGTSEQGQPNNDPDKDALVSKVGDTASFGSYDSKPIEWLCIAVQGEKALLITKDCVTLDVFNEPMPDGAQVVWADCTLRAWLNGEFLNGLSAEEQAMILDTEHSDKENLDYADYPEEEVEWKTCTDKVFLLSANEVQTYFTDDESRIAKIILSDAERSASIARYEEVFNMDDGTGADMLEELMKNGGAVEYWLRSNGRGYMVQTVNYEGNYDDYCAYGVNQDVAFLGVRPAVWVSLAPSESAQPAAQSSTSQPEKPQPSSSAASSSGAESSVASADSLDSVPDFLAIYGLTEEDVTPEHFLAFGDVTTSGQSKPGEVDGSAYLVIQADPEKTQEEHIRAWFERIYTAMQVLSKDGKLHRNSLTIGTDEDEESTLEALFTNPLWEKLPGTMWSYPCKLLGNDVILDVATSYDITTGEYKMGFIVSGM